MDWRAILALTSLGLACVGCKGAAASGNAADNQEHAPAAATGGGDAGLSVAGSSGSAGRAGGSTAGSPSLGGSAAAGAGGAQPGGAGAATAGQPGSAGTGGANTAAAGVGDAADEDAGAAGSAGGVCNLACVRGKHCELVQVQCIRAPCPPVAQCVDDVQRVACGGFAARPCPGAGECIDDPTDSCDPKHGGADCGGICECSNAAPCPQGQRWNSDATVCACTP